MKTNEPASTNTIRLHRVLRAAPEKIYRAFLDADAMAKWLPPNGLSRPPPDGSPPSRSDLARQRANLGR
jgi:uncharacterized protein YndB with AHSA1/START domain